MALAQGGGATESPITEKLCLGLSWGLLHGRFCSLSCDLSAKSPKTESLSPHILIFNFFICTVKMQKDIILVASLCSENLLGAIHPKSSTKSI